MHFSFLECSRVALSYKCKIFVWVYFFSMKFYHIKSYICNIYIYERRVTHSFTVINL